MPSYTLRTPATFFVVAVMSLALASCGSSTPPVVCPLAGNSTCTCGQGASACPVSPGPEFLYAAGSGQIQAFSIDHNSGALSTVASVAGPASTLGLTAVNNQSLYVSDSTQAQLDGFSINQTTGALTAVMGSPFSTGAFSLPAGLASPAGSDLLYAGDVASVDGFTIDGTGTPTAISGSPFPSGTNLFLAADPSGKFLYTSIDGPPGSVFAFTIGSTGALTAVSGSPFTIPGQTVLNSRPFGIVDTGSYVYAALSDTNQIAAFSIVSGTGALTPVPNSPFSAGMTPTALVFANGFLYVLNDGGITGYSINSSNGALTPVAGSPFAIIGDAIAADSFGEYLYVAGLSGIQAFSINSANGTLTPVAGSPFPATAATVLTVVQIPPP
ncbi:MAG: beta-propeller fold lactonase family protein [Candidatus Sulfotelmatobacter sp.]